MSEQTRGQKIVKEWREDIADSYHVDKVLDRDLASRFDQELAKDRPKLTLDLRGTILDAGTWNQRVSLSALLGAIRAQLPGVEVIT